MHHSPANKVNISHPAYEVSINLVLFYKCMNINLFLIKKIALKMRITTFLLVFCGLNLFAVGTYSQNAKVKISAQDISLKEVLREIEKQTDYLFV